MLDAYSQAASRPASARPASVGAVDSTSSAGTSLRPSCLPLALRQLESQLGMLLATFHDDAGFWAAFAKLMQHLDEDLGAAERARLRSHADFLLVRAGMSSWTLIAATQGAAARTVQAPPRRT
ncbi:hypothetical protein FZ025_12295 [Xanthomonas hyacinthi]|uniref:Uncharacterized protein n=1 Tax=Xanthomonas hyacinthi TaxID=56455 RepID=A0A2S7ESS1_9XANT|nr:hypothetical protein [Xanthomonas hyacinthi]KLD77741.1 hypothetical protein Y886_14005 [Xanthomonas hyacinthi DSM 19077]PPU96170.1 hypothetical protein XhyaCFBP1156_16395 [Xanthomonas hyacinthi]QGY77374.1 hypothetical protein FZ025_12295 [Xanthomonas hyacinthi]